MKELLPEILSASIAFVASTITSWLAMRDKILKMESKIEYLEKENQRLEQIENKLDKIFDFIHKLEIKIVKFVEK